MGMLGRLARVVRAQLGDWVQGAEDPEAMLDRAVVDMQQDLLQLRQAIAQAIATQKRTERQCHQTAQRVQEWYNRAQLALNQGDDDQARDALAQRHTYQRMQSQLTSHLEAQKTVIASLKTNLRDLEVKIADVRTRRDMYIARARSAEASQRIQEMISQVGQGRSLGTLSQMEDRVLDLETQASAMAELNQTLQTQSLDDRFEALERSAATEVEQELAALKAHPTKHLPDS